MCIRDSIDPDTGEIIKAYIFVGVMTYSQYTYVEAFLDLSLIHISNGYDDSPVKLENTHAPIKSVGNSTTTPKDLVCDEDVKIVL